MKAYLIRKTRETNNTYFKLHICMTASLVHYAKTLYLIYFLYSLNFFLLFRHAFKISFHFFHDSLNCLWLISEASLVLFSPHQHVSPCLITAHKCRFTLANSHGETWNTIFLKISLQQWHLPLQITSASLCEISENKRVEEDVIKMIK